MNKIALCFWGVTRALDLTYKSINRNIYNALSDKGYEYDVFMHVNKIDQIKGYRASGENYVSVEFDQYKLLNPGKFAYDEQSEMFSQIDMSRYKTKPDPWNNNYKSVELFVLSMYSKAQVTQMMLDSKTNYDCVVFLRPDILYLDRFPVEILGQINDTNCYMPGFHTYTRHKHTTKVNDRFSVSSMEVAGIIGNSYHTLHNYCDEHACHSESFLSYNLHNNGIEVLPIHNFKFIRVRADGKVPVHDLRHLRMEKLIELGYTIHKYSEGDGKLINIHEQN